MPGPKNFRFGYARTELGCRPFLPDQRAADLDRTLQRERKLVVEQRAGEQVVRKLRARQDEVDEQTGLRHPAEF